MSLRALVGSGDRIALFTLPFLAVGLALNVLWPGLFRVSGPPGVLKTLSIVIMIPGVAIWAWSAALILTRVPRHELITTGPYSVVKHPLYTSVAFLVLPWVGFLLNTWVLVPIGIALYVGSRLFSPEEERNLAEAFGLAWDAHCKSVKIPWL